ncbi:11988_t:CDS:2, partial [Cetraspora pellucida]
MVVPHKSQLKKPRVKRAQSSTTLQFAPPDWVSNIFQNGTSTFMVHPGETRAGYMWNLLNQMLSKLYSVPYLAPKLLFITICAGMGSVLPYLPIFYNTSLALTSTQIGIVFSIAPFISALSCPLWTGLADKYQSHRFIIIMLYFLATISVVGQMIIPLTIDVHNSSNNGLVMICVLFAALWFAFFGVPVNALVDSGVLKILGDKRELYGQQRLWGSISYGSSTLIIGLLWSAVNNINFVDDFEIITTRSNDISFKPLISLDDDNDDVASSSRSNVKFSNSSTFPPTSLNLPTASFASNPTSSMKMLLTNPSVVTLLM